MCYSFNYLTKQTRKKILPSIFNPVFKQGSFYSRLGNYFQWTNSSNRLYSMASMIILSGLKYGSIIKGYHLHNYLTHSTHIWQGFILVNPCQCHTCIPNFSWYINVHYKYAITLILQLRSTCYTALQTF